jgi:hypothetical protein
MTFKTIETFRLDFQDGRQNLDELFHVVMKLMSRCGQFPDVAVRGLGKITNMFVGLVHANGGVCLVLQNELDRALDFFRDHTEFLLGGPQRCSQ